MFSVWHIGLTALVTAVVTAVVTMGGSAVWPRLPAQRTAYGDLLGVSISAGFGVLLWRLGANVPTLNDDPIPGVSPADLLSAPMAYVAASIYVRVRGSFGGASELMAVAPALAAVVALVVNIVTI